MGIETLLSYLVRIVEYEVIKYGPQIERAVIEKLKEVAECIVDWAKSFFVDSTPMLPPPKDE